MMMMIVTKHVAAVLMQILIILLKQFSCESVDEKNFDIYNVSSYCALNALYLDDVDQPPSNIEKHNGYLF
jgi:hypothetical protein